MLDKIKAEPVVLIIAPLSGHYATLLRETVRATLQNHKVYITDWKTPAWYPPAKANSIWMTGVSTMYKSSSAISKKSMATAHTIRRQNVHCTVLSGHFTHGQSKSEKTPISMTMMGGPIDARRSPTAVNNLAMTHPISWFEKQSNRPRADQLGAGRRVYPGFMQHTGFVAMNLLPRQQPLRSFEDFDEMHAESAEAHRKFYDEYNAVLDMDADYYLETLETVFQQFKLVRGT